MTIMQVYCIRDSKADVFNLPFFQVNEAVAVRTFQTMVDDPSSQIHAHPGDYALYGLGEYDDDTGLFNTIDPHLIMLGLPNGAVKITKKDS